MMVTAAGATGQAEIDNEARAGDAAEAARAAIDRSMRFVRSRSGSEEVRSPSIEMRRSARNLLLVIDDSRTGLEWVERLGSCEADDLVLLTRLGLVDQLLVRDRSRPDVPLEVAIAGWSDAAIKRLLTRSAAQRLGLFQALRFMRDLERCEDRASLLAMAGSFVALLEASHGSDAARRFRLRLAAGDESA